MLVCFCLALFAVWLGLMACSIANAFVRGVYSVLHRDRNAGRCVRV